MYQGFWATLDKPIIGLSPMDGVSDFPFRYIQKKYGQPAVIYTEFTSVEGVCHGATRLLKDFLYDEPQRPIVAQIFGSTPEYFRQTATILCELGFDGIDINMGCPAKNVSHSGAGATLITTPDLAKKIVQATKAGVQDWLNGKTARDGADIAPAIWHEIEKRHQQLPDQYQQRREIPVSIKTRIGYSQPIVEDWISLLLETEPAAIAIHGRTLKQQYGGQANWQEIAKTVTLRNQTQTETLILGNGDVESLADAQAKISQTGVDGVLIGRGALGNPFIFTQPQTQLDNPRRFQVAVEHAELYESLYGQDPQYQFLPMRKHLGWYVKGIPNAAQIRIELFQTNTATEVKAIFEKYQLLK